MCDCSHSPTQAMRDMSSVYPSKQSQVYPSCTRTHRPFSHPFSTPHSSARSPSNASYGSVREREGFWVNNVTIYNLVWSIHLKCIILLTSWCFVIVIEGQRAVRIRRSKVIFRADLVLMNWASNQSILTIWPTGITKLTDITHSGIGSWMWVKKKKKFDLKIEFWSIFLCVWRFFMSHNFARI